MNDLTVVRVGLADILREGTDLAIYTTAPEEPAGDDDEVGEDAYPLVYVLPGEPYIDFPEGTPFGWALMHCNVSVVSAAGTSDAEAEAVDGMLAQVLATLLEHDDDWTIGEVQQPGRVVLDNGAHLACPVELTRLIKLI